LPKEYGQLRHDIWSDDDFLNLTVPAQHLYMTLIGDPTLNYCGVVDWRPGKLSQRAAENPPGATVLAAAELSNAFFLVIDEDTEEALLRSYLRHDPILKNPRLAVTMSKEYAVIGSRKIRAALVYELNRLRKENPDLPAWEKPTVKTVLRQNAVNAKEMDTDLPVAAAQYLPRLDLPTLPSGLPSGLPSDLGKGANAFTRGLQHATRNEQPVTATSSIEDAASRTTTYPQASTDTRDGDVKAIRSGVAS
jgi:hypothetical protein